MNIKDFVVVQHIAGEGLPMIWTKKDWESHFNWSKEHNRVIQFEILATFSKDSPYQGSAVTILMDIDSQTIREVYFDKDKAIEACRANRDLAPFTFPVLDAISPAGDGWVSEKPEFKSECTFLTATRIFRSDKWNYSVWSIAKIDGDDGWYLGIVDGTGDEWGDIEDLTADMYLILSSPPNKSA